MTTLAQRAPSTLSGWSATLVRALDAQGVDGRALAEQAGIDPGTLGQSEARVPRAALTRLWQLAVEATGNPAFGLSVARHVMQTTFHGLGYAVLASSSLKEAFERIVRYRRLIGDLVELSLVEEGERCRFVIDVSAPPGAPPEAVDAIVAVTLRQARMLRGDPSFRPLSVSLQRPAPRDPAPYTSVVHAPVVFAQAVNAIEFARADLEAPLPSANAELARQNEEVVLRYLARLQTATLATKVQQALLEALPDGAPSKEAIARKLGMSPRNLQRHLADEGVSFKELLTRARTGLALSYIAEGRLSVTEIAFLLGFADTSTFSRAFKQWTGKSPREFAAGGGPVVSEPPLR